MAFKYYGLNPTPWYRVEHFGEGEGGSAMPRDAVRTPSMSASGCGKRVHAGV